jgi:hypothetical protein
MYKAEKKKKQSEKTMKDFEVCGSSVKLSVKFSVNFLSL